MPSHSNTIRPYNTTVTEHNGVIRVKFYDTVIAMIDTKTCTAVFNSGGYHTPTTVDRLNSTWQQYIGSLRPFGRHDRIICFNGVELVNIIAVSYGAWQDIERAGYTGDDCMPYYARLWSELPVPLTANYDALEAMQARYDTQPMPALQSA